MGFARAFSSDTKTVDAACLRAIAEGTIVAQRIGNTLRRGNAFVRILPADLFASAWRRTSYACAAHRIAALTAIAKQAVVATSGHYRRFVRTHPGSLVASIVGAAVLIVTIHGRRIADVVGAEVQGAKVVVRAFSVRNTLDALVIDAVVFRAGKCRITEAIRLARVDRAAVVVITLNIS